MNVITMGQTTTILLCIRPFDTVGKNMSEKLFVRWNEFQENLNNAFHNLRSNKDFTDVTLACEDQTSIKAHKVILSACSPFFKKLLKSQTHPYPLIFMRGTKSNDLAAMMNFIYLGEASVFQEQLDSFLALAQVLELRGLDGSSEEKAAEYSREDETERVADFDQNKDVVSNVKYKSKGEMVAIQQETRVMPTFETSTMAQIQSMIEKQIDGFLCTHCGHKSRNSGHMREHVEKHIEGLEYPCNFCNKVYRSSVSLRTHKCILRN